MVKDKVGKQKPLYLKKAGDTKIRRHVKIKSAAHPFNPLYREYFEKRKKDITNRQRNFAGLEMFSLIDA